MNNSIAPVIAELDQTIIGKSAQNRLAVCCLLSHGHLLIEDLPGMGKTTLSHALATLFGLDYARIQFTSDLLPADMLGANIFDVQNSITNTWVRDVYSKRQYAIPNYLTPRVFNVRTTMKF